jgi:hypothetical protein
MLKKSAVLTLLAGMSLWVLARLLFAAEKQKALYIVPVYVFIFGLSRLRWILAVAFPLLFFVWNPGLFQGHAPVPKRSHVLLTVTTFLTAVWFIFWWKKEVAAEGPRYIYFVSAVNVVWIVTLWMLFARSRKGEPSFKMNLLFHWMLFAWLYLFAFPIFIGPLFRS